MGRVVGVVGAMAAVVLAAAVLVGGPGGLPWSSGCQVSTAEGAELLAGSIPEVATAVDEALAGDPAGSDLAAALGSGPVLTCRMAPIAATDTPKEGIGLTPAALALRDEVRATFGDVPDGGFGPEETLPGRRAGGEHSLGRAIDFFFRPYEDPDQEVAGWQLANWAVANADRLGVRTVIYRDRIWTAWRSGQGWRDYRFGGSDPDNPVNRHLDHVHVDVA